MRLACFFLFMATLISAGSMARAQSLRIRSNAPKMEEATESAWSSSLRYSVLTDYAEDVQPRGYTQSLRTSTAYKFDPNWSISADASLRAETFNGQIDKSQNQTYSETLNPSIAMEVDYEHAIMYRHVLTTFVHGEPLIDEPSRLEGYKGIIGGGVSLALNFWGKRYTMDHVVDASELLNTFKFADDTTANPDMFYTYKWVNSLRVYEQIRLSYTWGIKLTRYTDAFTGYSYSNTISLSTAGKHWAAALSYDNGGFTDNGDVQLWYIDQYRRVAMASLNYAF